MSSASEVEVVTADSENITQVESLCLKCGDNGVTCFYLTRIPHFKDIILSGFECPHCGWKNNEVQSAGAIAPKGLRYTLKAEVAEDLDRQIVKSEYAVVSIPELELEIPARSGKGVLTTVEGLLRGISEDLAANQPQRQVADENVFERIQSILSDIDAFLDKVSRPFTLVIDDITGGSFVEQLNIGHIDARLEFVEFRQETSKLAEIGFAVEDEEADLNGVDETPDDVYAFPGLCPSCAHDCETKMVKIDIPYFKEVIIMATVCDACGYKTNEIKSGGAIAPMGSRITLKAISVEDLSRDILKSETCSLQIPEIDLELGSGTLGGRFTTIEGLVRQIRDEIHAKVPWATGDSADAAKKAALDRIIARLDGICESGTFTLILNDPLSNSYIQNVCAPDPDPQLTIESYERSFEDNENLGLNDIVVEGYEGEEKLGNDPHMH